MGNYRKGMVFMSLFIVDGKKVLTASLFNDIQTVFAKAWLYVWRWLRLIVSDIQTVHVCFSGV